MSTFLSEEDMTGALNVAPIYSEVGRLYLGAMRAAINCALAIREILSHFAYLNAR